MNNFHITKYFKKSITKVIIAIGLFFISYLVLIAISIGLLIGCGLAGAFIISAKVSFITLTAGAGLFALGIMFFVFLIKFIFFKYTDENPYRVQVFQKDHPELFKLIREVSSSVGTHFPLKVFLSHDVNARVFYNSSFWSLFFPVKKNLDIGLGLINSVNKAELKAVLAHEFGHFSQRSMKLGSYVYTVNNVIYNLVYDYDRWDRTLEGWANAGGVFGFFALITFRLVELVRYVLRKSYNLINIPYMGLSREMEFHADHIAGEIAGKENMISALRRIEFCDIAFNQTLENLGLLANNQKLSKNIYHNHKYEIQKLSEYFNLKIENGLPLILDKDLELNTVKPRVIFKDQWASHPSREEREKRIMNNVELSSTSPNMDSWSIINHFQSTQEKVTENLYVVDYGDLNNFKFITNDEYINHKELEQSKYKINDFFNGFYNSRFLVNIELENNSDSAFENSLEEILKETYSKTLKLKFEKLQYDNNDLIILNQIKSKEINTKYFDFDNQKYHRRDINKVIVKLEKEIELLKGEIKTIEENAISINLIIAGKISIEDKDNLLKKYRDLVRNQGISEKHQEFVDTISGYQFTIYNKSRWQDEELKQFNRDLSKFEQNYKNYIKEIDFEKYVGITQKHREVLDSYLRDETSYIRIASFNIEGFNNFIDLIFKNHEFIYEIYLRKLKELTDIQIENYEKIGIGVVNNVYSA